MIHRNVSVAPTSRYETLHSRTLGSSPETEPYNDPHYMVFRVVFLYSLVHQTIFGLRTVEP